MMHSRQKMEKYSNKNHVLIRRFDFHTKKLALFSHFGPYVNDKEYDKIRHMQEEVVKRIYLRVVLNGSSVYL